MRSLKQTGETSKNVMLLAAPADYSGLKLLVRCPTIED
jgi:hypothetical protein